MQGQPIGLLKNYYCRVACCFCIWYIDDFAEGGDQLLSYRLRNIVLIVVRLFVVVVC